MGPRDLIHKLHDEPFQPFRIRLSDATTIDIVDPSTVIVGPTSAILPMETLLDEDGYRLVKRWRTVALSHMVHFVDIDPPKEQRRPRRKGA